MITPADPSKGILLSIVFVLWTDMLYLHNKKKNSNTAVTTTLEQNINNMNQLPKKSETIQCDRE
jgi:hypothetical protein